MTRRARRHMGAWHGTEAAASAAPRAQVKRARAPREAAAGYTARADATAMPRAWWNGGNRGWHVALAPGRRGGLVWFCAGWPPAAPDTYTYYSYVWLGLSRCVLVVLLSHPTSDSYSLRPLDIKDFFS